MARKAQSEDLFGATSRSIKGVDELDLKIIDQLILGDRKTKEIAQKVGRPLSTVQRRIRSLIDQGVVKPNIELSYGKLGLKHGNLLVYLRNGDVRSIADRIAEMEGVLGVSIHIGNSDVVAFFLYKDSAHLLELTSRVRQLEGVERVVWSEEVYQVPLKNSVSLEPMVLAPPYSE
jgi:DNA-binding Lrp family transcriptional regulator